MTKKIKLKISQRLTKKKTRRNGYGAKHCRFCGSDEQKSFLDYKNSSYLRAFLTERGKILPARISGCCSRHQRAISTEIKKSRTMALMPFTAQYF
jgi:small subunit ribosomal protein S18